MHGKFTPKQMITPEEAVRLTDHEHVGITAHLASDFKVAYIADQKRRGMYEHLGDIFLHAFLFDAGRIQGIREERARRRPKS